MYSSKAQFFRGRWPSVVARNLTIIAMVCSVSLSTIASSARAADAKYPTQAIVASFTAACEDLSDENTISGKAKDSGWREVLRGSSSHTAIVFEQIWRNQREAITNLESSGSAIPLHFAIAFENTISGEDLSLIVFGMSNGDWLNVSCIVYDFDETRKPSKKELEIAAGQKVTEFEADSGLARWKWVPGFIQGHQGEQIQYIEPGSSAAQLFPNAGLQIRAVKNVSGAQKDEVKE